MSRPKGAVPKASPAHRPKPLAELATAAAEVRDARPGGLATAGAAGGRLLAREAPRGHGPERTDSEGWALERAVSQTKPRICGTKKDLASHASIYFGVSGRQYPRLSRAK